MMVFQWLVLILALIGTVPIVCRLGVLHFKLHKARVIVMHLAMAYSILWGGYAGYMGMATLGDLCAVVAPLMWIWLSYPSWSSGVPDHFHIVTKSAPYPPIIDPSELRHVGGAGK